MSRIFNHMMLSPIEASYPTCGLQADACRPTSNYVVLWIISKVKEIYNQ
jgi:hypothetical protein